MIEKYALIKKQGEIIFCEFEPGETLFFLQEGQVRLIKILNNKEKTLAIIRPGDIFGEMSILEKQPRSATAIAETDVKLLELNKESFLLLVKNQPALGIKLLKIFAARIIDQKRKLIIINHTDNKIKILDTLLMLHEKGMTNIISEKKVAINIDAKEVANWAGISIDESNRTLTALKSSNYIDFNPATKTVTLQDIDIIRSIIEREHKKTQQTPTT
ncbi:hypothetical protein COTS27_01285 [Spirochaetota bacterium]|nr:hypothetical protein COTS27_01285 [Spirochaetota bacterium]